MLAPALLTRRVASWVALVASAVWLGGLVALGAIAAPVIFSIVAFPSSADAMTIVFRRFDVVAMTCAAVVLATEAARAMAGLGFRLLDGARAAACAAASALAVVQGTSISPRIAALHFAGVVRAAGPRAGELSRLHHLAELLGQAQALFLLTFVLLQVITLSSPGEARAGGRDR